MNSYTFTAKSKLTEQELREIQELSEVCNHFDKITLKLNEDMLADRPGTGTNDFLCYDQGKLVGYGALFVFHQGEAEVSGMVHPDYRGQGIFRKLQSMMEQECQHRQIPALLFIVQRGSSSGKAYMERAGAAYSVSEYWMEWEAAGKEGTTVKEREGALAVGSVSGKQSANANMAVRLRPSTPEDMERLIQLNVLGFQMDEERAREMSAKLEHDPKRLTYIIEHESAGSVGKISVSKQADHAFIYGFVVDPAQQGKGIGKKALMQSIDMLRKEGFEKIILEVATENSTALTLYEACGFEVKAANDYYQYPLQAPEL
ncbi:GNAT family N-acetyltransferase [Brevibacillus ruminantium]|uniref:GNAT family N-acetyltransferase n=1 Tax=Brevibacillus ruminantium TaxID=2950604 RepID=A0ABY4WAQ4_9BACL|nr:GNAT family N-acetyltransferase [Brevibacillus ruminantium]USG63931.1 GNAT family N-acetyltransferase [Brevibacillus ruminantium]